ncbi:MAG TPA: hypothetical protein VG713_11670 [Pirellulales bacterium]|nr:hypothetical protein [Pirellulales bacterium]
MKIRSRRLVSIVASGALLSSSALVLHAEPGDAIAPNVPVVAAATLLPDDADEHIEIIQERYPNAAIKVERSVTRDTEGNYVNHGPWAFWDESGHLVTKGVYRANLRHGQWARLFKANEGNMFAGPQFKGFDAPFVSEAMFEDGQLNGPWTITDSKDRVICEMEFKHDVQDAAMIWYYPTGQKAQEVTFRDGKIEGDLVEYAADGKVTRKDTYLGGRKLGKEVETYSPGVKKSERAYLYAMPTTVYSFADGTVRSIPAPKDKQKMAHGLSTWWYKNGQKQLEGEYDQDMPVGKFTWWHSNGQKQTEGSFIAGMQSGRWVWWHPNGQKQSEGDYTENNRIGKWYEWKADGKIVSIEDFTNAKATEEVVSTSPTPPKEPIDASAARQAKQPSRRR